MPIHSLTELDSLAKRHNFFRFACHALEPNNHTFYFCVQAYKAAPSKRKAIFIYDHFLSELVAPTKSGSLGTLDEAYSLLREVNVYENPENGGPSGQLTAVSATVSKIKKVKTKLGKLMNRKLVAEYKDSPADLFDDLQAQLESTMRLDWFSSFNPDVLGPAVDARFTKPIQLASKAMAEAGYNADDMGIY